MSESQWRQKGGSLSHKNACKEFGLTEAELIEAIKAEKLQYKLNYVMLQQIALRNENTFAALMEAVKHCSIGQITTALFEVGGQYHRSM